MQTQRVQGGPGSLMPPNIHDAGAAPLLQDDLGRAEMDDFSRKVVPSVRMGSTGLTRKEARRRLEEQMAFHDLFWKINLPRQTVRQTGSADEASDEEELNEKRMLCKTKHWRKVQSKAKRAERRAGKIAGKQMKLQKTKKIRGRNKAALLS